LNDGQGPQVAGKVAAEAETTVVRTFVAVATTVLVLVDVDKDDQTPHVSDEVGLLAAETEKTGLALVLLEATGTEVEDGLTATGVYDVEEVSPATGDVLEFPSQLPQDEDRAPLSQLPRLSTTPAKTELAKARRTNELFTILAT
jgi:hypothetical protein